MPSDSTYVFGNLVMPQEATAPSAVPVSVWAQDPVLSALTIAAAIIILLLLNNIYRILPTVAASVFRWKEGLNLETSVQQSRTRNWVCAAFVLPLCIIVGKYLMPDESILICLAYISAYALARLVIYLLIRYRLFNDDYLAYSHKCVYNYIIVLSLLFMVTSLVLSLTNSGQPLSAKILTVEIMVIYLLCVGRRSHFLRCKYHVFRTFLYLCALEFLPSGLLVYLWLK